MQVSIMKGPTLFRHQAVTLIGIICSTKQRWGCKNT